MPGKYKIDCDKGVYKQIESFKGSENIYVRVSKGGAELLSYFKMHCTKALNRQKELYLLKNFPNVHIHGIIDTPAMRHELQLMKNNPKVESYTYGFMNTLLVYHFKASDGYIVCPQSKRAAGEVDLIIKKDGNVVCVVGYKALDANNYPFTHLYAQATQYANTNTSSTSVFVIVKKGDYFSFGVYIEDFHSIKKFKMKSILFHG